MINFQISSRMLCVISIFFFAHNIQCQGYSFSGSRSQALANASVCLSDVFAYHNNPANAAGQKEVSFGLAYENRFLLKELQHQSYAVLIPLKFGVLSIGGNSFGYRDFRTFKNGVGYSMKLL